MSKDSIMALFNQKPSNPTVPNNPVNPLLQQQGFMPNNMGGRQIPANLGLGAQHPQNIQPQQPLVGGNGFGGGGNLLNNPFLAMSQPTSDPNNVRKISKKNFFNFFNFSFLSDFQLCLILGFLSRTEFLNSFSPFSAFWQFRSQQW